MPVAHFPGRRGWGYDGVFHYAPFNPYGSADDLKAFVDAAHGLGLTVFLDVVYNHIGPTGNFLSKYAPEFFHEDNPTPWGSRIAFANEPVRRFFIENAIYWLTEYRLDGLRLDAIDQIDDDSDVHFLAELSPKTHAAVTDRTIHLITENPANGTDLLVETEHGTRLYKADWNDDFHHAIHSAVTKENSGYYRPLSEEPWKNAGRTLAQGHLRQGKRILPIEPPHPSSLPTTSYVHFLQNHDQIGNRARGDRLHENLEKNLYMSLVEMLVLSPQIPLFFMGDDHLSSRPFRFFADYDGKLRSDVWKNREREALNFGGFPDGFGADEIPDPSDPTTFENCRRDRSEQRKPKAREWRGFLKRLFKIRATEIVPTLGKSMRGGEVLDAPDGCIFVDWIYPGEYSNFVPIFRLMMCRCPSSRRRKYIAIRAPWANGCSVGMACGCSRADSDRWSSARSIHSSCLPTKPAMSGLPCDIVINLIPCACTISYTTGPLGPFVMPAWN
ncbi:hypothetical protein IHQ71_30175 (plasmid) [Rhizobium sp. TH2]|uniref:alpha-amylase family glycosyl hydrolase n=1 Tax=Rhizobium sp. TH2 TaxID=2775403 RepID=UPI00220AC93E|nr:hypothetical protein IHQ71_30175 [Rhizobium sp. TH2]